MKLAFTKMHGLGNDFVVLDTRVAALELSPEQIRYISDRRFGIGCDQVLFIDAATHGRADARYRVFNADGSPSEHCGNGVRCVAAYLRRCGAVTGDHVEVEIGDRNCRMYFERDGIVRVDMGLPRLEPAEIPLLGEHKRLRYTLTVAGRNIDFGAVSMGNPHAVIAVPAAPDAPVAEIGLALQAHASFPQRVNVGFMQIVGPNHIILRVYERGAGETLACGTGACAAVVIGRIWGRLADAVDVDVPGGRLRIAWSGAAVDPVWMSGPTAYVFDGKIEL